MCRGKIESGFVEVGQTLKVFDVDGKLISTETVSKIFKSIGKSRIELERATVGDIVTICGISKAKLTNLITSSAVPKKI